MTTKTIAGQECYVLETSGVSVAVTRTGGHTAPVAFFADSGKPVSPYYVSPWQEEGLDIDEPVLRPLRGDFFCLPFGANAPAAGAPSGSVSGYGVHGETATRQWEPVGVERRGGVTTLTLRMETKVRPGAVRKEITVVDGHSTLYVRHVIEGNAGRTSVGHHATLGVHNGPLAIRTSPIRFGSTYPYQGPPTADGEYYSLAAGQQFESLERVPTVWKDPAFTDCTRFPAREGFIDILQVYQTPGSDPGWVTATCTEAGFLWYALKDTAVLPSTVFWMENHGRHGAPWSGRNACIGLEDVCGFFADGIPKSAEPNSLTDSGIATCHELSGSPFTVSYVQGVVRIPAGFDAVASVRFGKDEAVFTAQSGKEARAAVNAGFVFGEV